MNWKDSENKVRTIKRTILGIIVVLTVALAVGCRCQSIPMEEEKLPVVEVGETETENQEAPVETSVVEEEIAEEEIVEEIVNAPEIEGLKFDQATKTYLAEANNPYGLEAGIEAGVYLKEAVEINGEMEDTIGLIPEVIEPIQKKIYDKEKEYLCPIMFNLKKIVGDVKIKEMDVETKIGEGYSFLGINLPPNTNFYIPASGNWIFSPEDNQFPEKSLIFDYDIGVENDLGGIQMYFKEVNIIKDMEKSSITIAQGENEKETEITIGDDMLKLGEVFGEIADNSYLEMYNNELDYFKFKEPGIYQFGLVLYGKNDSPLRGVEKLLSVEGSEGKIKVFILPNF